jgi:hypothetical protein
MSEYRLDEATSLGSGGAGDGNDLGGNFVHGSYPLVGGMTSYRILLTHTISTVKNYLTI